VSITNSKFNQTRRDITSNENYTFVITRDALYRIIVHKIINRNFLSLLICISILTRLRCV